MTSVSCHVAVLCFFSGEVEDGCAGLLVTLTVTLAAGAAGTAGAGGAATVSTRLVVGLTAKEFQFCAGGGMAQETRGEAKVSSMEGVKSRYN